METISDMLNSILENVVKTDSVCNKHSLQLVQFKNHTPFCQKCVIEKKYQEETQRVTKALEADHLRRTSKMLKLNSLLPDRTIWNASFDNYETTNSETKRAKDKSVELAKRYCDLDNHFNVVLNGTPGTGKSHLAMSILNYVNENSVSSCLFISVNELMRRIRASFNDRSNKQNEAYWIDMLKSVDLLVLDDLGSESVLTSSEKDESSNYNQNVLFGILDARTRTIITTNFNSEKLKKVYNSKIISRMYRGLSKNEIVTFTAETQDKRNNFDF